MSDTSDILHYQGSVPINVEFLQAFGHGPVWIRQSHDAWWARCDCGEQMTARFGHDQAVADAVAHLEFATGKEWQ